MDSDSAESLLDSVEYLIPSYPNSKIRSHTTYFLDTYTGTDKIGARPVALPTLSMDSVIVITDGMIHELKCMGSNCQWDKVKTLDDRDQVVGLYVSDNLSKTCTP